MMVARIARHPAAARRAVGLIRVSKARDDMTSPDVQRHAIATHATQQGITIVEWIEGIDESGSRRKSAWWARLDQAVTMVEAGEIDTILVWKFSRVARNRLRWATALDRVDVAGGTVESATEPGDRTPAGEFTRGMLGEINQYQARLIGEGWKETHARRIREGKPATGRARFGYVRDRENDTYTPDPDTAPVVLELYRRAVAGQGMATLARWLNDSGHRTSNGNPWATIGVTRFMDRGFAAGLLWVDGQLHPGAHDPIIDGELWSAYLARRAGTKRPPRGTVRMLSGLLKCGTCGGPMMSIRSTGDQGAYGCAARARGGSCAQPVSIARHIAEATLTGWIANLPTRIELLRDAEAKEAKQRLATIEDRGALTRMMRRQEDRLSKLTNMLLDSTISQDAYDATAAPINAELVSLRDRHRRSAPLPESRLFEDVPRVAEGWPTLDPAAQNRAARSLIDRIVISPSPADQRVRIIPRWEATTN